MVTFIIRDYPDLDHIFPLIHYFLKKKESITILNFEINLDLNSDPRIIFLNNNYKNNLNIYDVYNVKGQRFLIDWLINFLSSEKYKKVNFKNLEDIKKSNNFFNLYFLLLICFLKRTIFSSKTFFEKYIFNDKWANNIINKIDVTSLVLDDSYYFNYNRPQSFIKICKTKKINITLVPHTCHMFTRKEDIDNLKSKELKNFYPNLVVTSNKMKSVFNSCGIGFSKIKNLGSARFSQENVSFLESIYNTNAKFSKKTVIDKKLKVLYIDGAYDDKYEKKKLIEHVSKLSFIELIVKAHPRGIFLSSQLAMKEKQFKKDSFSNFSIDISTPTKILIEHSDVIIGTYSSVLIEAMLSYKKIILPRFFLKDKLNFKIFYEEHGFAEVCVDLRQVISSLYSFKKDLMIKQDVKEKTNIFIQEYVYGGNLNSSKILENYYQLIK